MKREEFLQKVHPDQDEKIRIVSAWRAEANKRIRPEMIEMTHSLDDVTVCEEQFAGGTHYYAVRPVNTADHAPCMINLHGGGWVNVHADRDIYFSRRIAYRTGYTVLDVDYKLAPECPYPGAVDEIEAFVYHVIEHADEYRIDPERIVLCGQSSGGNLAFAAAFRLKKNLRSVISCYAPTDLVRDKTGGADMDERIMRTEYYGIFYTPDFADRFNPEVSMVYADEACLKDLPPMDFIIGELDDLKYDFSRFYEKSSAAGVSCTYREFPGSRHAFVINLSGQWKEAEDHICSLLGGYATK